MRRRSMERGSPEPVHVCGGAKSGGALAILLCLVAGCGPVGHGRPDADQSGDADADQDGGSDADQDGGSDADQDGDGVLPYVPQCGNGVLDDGEECDDRNRLDHDGCDWLCQLGDGEPPPEPEPGVEPYVPEGEPVELEETQAAVFSPDRLPFVWTGSEHAAALFETDEETAPEATVRFLRFDTAGTLLDTDWEYPSVALHGGIDLVWTGAGYGLFYADLGQGIIFLGLDSSGKPRGEPVLVVADPAARAPAADLAGDGFVLAWFSGGTGWCTGGSGGTSFIRVRLVGADGSVEGLAGPVTVEDHAGGPPDVATGPDGFGVSTFVDGYRDAPDCSYRFVGLSQDLSEAVYSGVLSNSSGGDLLYDDGHYVTAWTHWEDMIEGFAGELCVARFTDEGELARAPVCTSAESGVHDNARLSAGDEGLAMVAKGEGSLVFLRTDHLGSAVAPMVPFAGLGHGVAPDTYAITWAGDAFAVLYSDMFHNLLLTRFVAAE